jgi:hypothetical protein
MKFLRILLAILIISSSLYPCMDIENISFAESSFVNTSSQETHSESEDNCSPFCICACCSISFSLDNYSSLSDIFYSTNSIIHFQDNYLFNPFLSIWQPPKA